MTIAASKVKAVCTSTEVALVRERFGKDNIVALDNLGLLGPHTCIAHGIHLSERELTRLSESGSTIVHCPTSNTFLGSGLFRLHDAQEPRRPVRVALATDIGGGTRFSMLSTMHEAYKIAQLNGRPFSAAQAFYLATLGSARALYLEDREKIEVLAP